MSTIPVSQFTGQHVPEYLWPDLIEEFGVDIGYHTVEGEILTVCGLLLEGMEGEFKTGGRYLRCVLDHSDLPRPPQASDWIELSATTYDVESVEATLYNISRCVIKLSGQSWLTR